MEWYGKIYCISVDELTRDDRSEYDASERLAPIMSIYSYKWYLRQGAFKVARRGGGKGCTALVDINSLPEEIRQRVEAKYGKIETLLESNSPINDLFRKAYTQDIKALSYYIAELNNRNLSLTQERIMELANEYTTNVSVIKAVQKLRTDNALYRKVRGRGALSWASMANVIKFFRDELGHTLGTSPTRFAEWVRRYEREGYDALISKKFGNDNTRKVDVKTERMLMELASDKHRPHGKTVWQWYCDFLAGEVEYISPTTGEVYDPRQFPDLSEKTVGDVLSKPLNEARLSKTHDARHDYNTTLRPYHKRIKPRYSLGMVSMDDKDFSIKIKWCKEVTKQVRGREVVTKQWVETALKAYICYDVASEAIIGYAFSGEKNRDIFEGCVRSMYRNLLNWGLGQPYEAQVENHLVSLYKETMMKSGILFPEVSFAGAENSQEKYAERYNEVLKYQFEKYAIDEAIGRPHARLAANRTKNRKVSDTSNTNYLQGEYGFDEAVQAYEQVIAAYNNALHPKQKLYPGKTRLEVLLTCVHPEIQPINMMQLARWAGNRVDTSIIRGQFTANYENYSVSTAMLDRLKGRDGKVEAYYWAQDDAEQVNQMYLYQDDVYLGICPRIVPYQVSKLERKRGDMRLLAAQQARVTEWDREIEDKAPEGIIKISATAARQIELTPVRVVAMPLDGDYELDEVDGIASWASQTKEYAHRGVSDL